MAIVPTIPLHATLKVDSHRAWRTCRARVAIESQGYRPHEAPEQSRWPVQEIRVGRADPGQAETEIRCPRERTRERAGERIAGPSDVSGSNWSGGRGVRPGLALAGTLAVGRAWAMRPAGDGADSAAVVVVRATDEGAVLCHETHRGAVCALRPSRAGRRRGGRRRCVDRLGQCA